MSKISQAKRKCKVVGCDNLILSKRTQFCNKHAFKSTLVKASLVYFINCNICNELFTAKTKRTKYCEICETSTIKGRYKKKLKKLERKCLNPACGKEFTTYRKSQFACGASCSNIVVSIRRQYNLKMRRFLGLCVSCGAEAWGNALCDGCQNKANMLQKKNRAMLKGSGLCQECGKNKANSGGYRCDSCIDLMRARKDARTCAIDGCDNIPALFKRYCDECIAAKEQLEQVCKVYFIKCKECNSLFTAKYPSKIRCDSCIPIRLKRLSTQRNRENKGLKLLTKTCAYHHCDNIFKTYRSSKTTCSDLCSKRMIKRNQHQKERITRNIKISDDKYIEKVNINVLFKRDNKRCQICQRKLNLIRANNHPLQATIDHIIPLIQGGEHSYKNTQLVCRKCNSFKSGGAAYGGDQLRLFG